MKRQLPPLNYLRPFEATARLGSTVQAANELGVTHSAISRQIKLLERWLDIKLFRRSHGGLVLTAEGADYYDAVSHILNLLDHTTCSLIGNGRENVIRFQSSSAFLTRWLIPRINNFYQKRSGFDVWISESRSLEFNRNVCDVAVSLEPGNWPDMEAIPLMPDLIFPVCNAKLACQIACATTLVEHRLLHTQDPFANWEDWFRSVGLPAEKSLLGSHIADLNLVLHSAVNGHGVALARGQLAMEDLSTKRLMTPLPHATRIENAYWLIRPKYGRISSAVRAFVAWIREEAGFSSKNLLKRQSLSQVTNHRMASLTSHLNIAADLPSIAAIPSPHFSHPTALPRC